jgi:TolB-like protein/Flp pilus assembly protein TadD
MPIGPSDAISEILASEVQAALERILRSRPFLRSKKLGRMLRFLVEETHSGRRESIKEYVLGVEVFDRPSSFDPRIDSIVRVEARRLRSALENYYQNEGRSDPLVIYMEKGSYVPAFRLRPNGSRSGTAESRVRIRIPRKWIYLSVGLALVVSAAWFMIARLRDSVLQKPVTIAVLPFDNLSNEPEAGYFCFGLTDEITTQLAKAGEVRVVARTSAANSNRGDIASIARQLKANAVLEGSVRNSSGRLLISAQLIDASNQLHIWSEMYERPNGDLLTVQNEIATAVTDATLQRLGASRRNELRKPLYSKDVQANQLYWKGAYLRVPTGTAHWRDELQKSAGYFVQAVQRDERFALAHAALADIYVSLAWERGGNPITADFIDRGRQAAKRALELDGNMAEASGALGAIQFFYDYDPASSEKSFRQALASDSSNGKARMWYAYALVMQRRFEEGISQARQARALDPLSYVATTHLAVVYHFSRHYEEALRLVGETLQVADTAPGHGLRGMIFAAQKKFPEAIAEYQAGLKLVPTHPYIKGMLGHAYALSGEPDKARELLKDAHGEYEKGGLSDLKLSYIYLALGDLESCFECLERDYEQRDPELPYINADPVFDPVRTHPRFAALLKKMNLQ